MAASKIQYNANFNQPAVWARPDDLRRINPLRITKVDLVQERRQRFRSVLTWVVVFPFSILAIPWFLLLLADLFII